MPADRFKSSEKRRQMQRERFTDVHFARRQAAAIRFQVAAEQKVLVPKQSVKDFLAEGGTINRVAAGIGGEGKLGDQGLKRFRGGSKPKKK